VVIEKVRMLHDDGKLTTGYDVISNRLCRHAQGWHHRPGQGHAQRRRERLLHRRHDSDHQRAGCDIPEEKPAMPASANMRLGD
jgi:hypothetical protein